MESNSWKKVKIDFNAAEKDIDYVLLEIKIDKLTLHYSII